MKAVNHIEKKGTFKITDENDPVKAAEEECEVDVPGPDCIDYNQ